MHIGSINFINNIISPVTTKTANRQAPSGPVSPDSGISQRNLMHTNTSGRARTRAVYTRMAVQIFIALALIRSSAHIDGRAR